MLKFLTAAVMSAGLVATAVLQPRLSWVRWVESDGRMSLLVYLAESLVLATLGLGWGFGLLGLGAAASLLAAVLTWLGLLVLSHVWHRAGLGHGPARTSPAGHHLCRARRA